MLRREVQANFFVLEGVALARTEFERRTGGVETDTARFVRRYMIGTSGTT
jgi:hypothetical protein